MSEAGQARARPDRTKHEALAAILGEFAHRRARQFARKVVQRERLVGDAELGKRQR